jgi:voltage-gated potassium channel
MLRELFFAFIIIAVCVVIHTIGMVVLFDWLLRKRSVIEKHSSLLSHALLLILVFGIVILLHLGETGIWAAFYYERGLFEDFETSFYFSLGSYTTIGYGDVVLPQRWRLFGGLEGISGVLLCGLSGAFIFVVVNALFQIRIQNKSSIRDQPQPGEYSRK